MNGVPSGSGKMTRSNGATYEGEFLEGMRHGVGKFTVPEFVYEGQYHRDTRQGKGKIVWDDGRVYDGDWEDDKRHGHGCFTDVAGNVYEGGFVHDALSGHGVTKRVDGGSYEGEFANGDRQGYGQFTGKDGDGTFVFVGQYVGNKRHGPGKMTRADGRVIDTTWEHGVEVCDEQAALLRTATAVGQTPTAELVHQTSALPSLTVKERP